MDYFGTVISIFVELFSCILSEPASIFLMIIFVELEVLDKDVGAVLRLPKNGGILRDDVDTVDASKLLLGICSWVVLLLCEVEDEVTVADEVDVKVLLRFQQSGNIFFCSSAITLARWEYCSLSSRDKLFQASPRRTLIALKIKRTKL